MISRGRRLMRKKLLSIVALMVANKVIFEMGLGSMPVGMSYSDIAKQVKEKQSDNLAISIAVQSDMDVVEKNDIDFDSMTVEQMDTYRLEYRNNLKEQHHNVISIMVVSTESSVD